MNKIVLKDGTEIENGSISKSISDKQIYISIPDMSLVEATLLFSLSSKTDEMVCYADIRKFTFTGYTIIDSVGVDGDGSVHIYMSGSGDTSINMEYTVPEEYLPKEWRTNKEVEKDGRETES